MRTPGVVVGPQGTAASGSGGGASRMGQPGSSVRVTSSIPSKSDGVTEGVVKSPDLGNVPSPPAVDSISLALRRVSEDPLLRPFLTATFDPVKYVEKVVQENQTEKVCEAIGTCQDTLNQEIQRFLATHRDVLLSGMQEVSALATQYKQLTALSTQITATVRHLRSELDATALPIEKTHLELSRLQAASRLVNELRQFQRARVALEGCASAALSGSDLGALTTAAKWIAELELLLVPTSPDGLPNPLLSIHIVKEHSKRIDSMAKEFRTLAEKRLEEAVRSQDALATSGALQVCFNLGDLPTVLRNLLQQLVKETASACSTLLTTDHNTSIAGRSTKRAVPGSVSVSQSDNLSTIANQRIQHREMSDAWGAILYERAAQVLALQRVFVRKEDPATNERFVDALRRLLGKSSTRSDTTDDGLLANSELLSWFWSQLSFEFRSFCDAQSTKPVTFSAVTRSYPYLRRAVLDVLERMRRVTREDGEGSTFLVRLTDGHSEFSNFSTANPFAAGDRSWDPSAQLFGNTSTDIFGSLQWTTEDILREVSSSFPDVFKSKVKSTTLENDTTDNSVKVVHDEHTHSDPQILLGLEKLRTGYLTALRDRMSAPIAQMFTVTEGYSTPVPSRRDVATFMRGVERELCAVAIESGDASLVALAGKQLVSVIATFLQHIRILASTSASPAMIALAANAAGNPASPAYTRSGPQDYNAQLWGLTAQLLEALELLPVTLAKELNSSVMSGGSSDDGSALRTAMTAEVVTATSEASSTVRQLALHELLDPLLTALSTHTISQLRNLLSESLTPSELAVKTATNVESSITVTRFTRSFPLLVRTFLQSLKNSPQTPQCVIVMVDNATRELCLRVLQQYVTVSSLVRPMTTTARRVIVTDLISLQELTGTLSPTMITSGGPVIAEIRAYHALLLDDSLSTCVAGTSTSLPPNSRSLLAKDYLAHLRPSLLLNWLLSAGPVQLPAPFESSIVDQPKMSAQSSNAAITEASTHYLLRLLDVQGVADDLTTQAADMNPFAQSLMARTANDLQSCVLLHAVTTSDRDKWRSVKSERHAWEAAQVVIDTFFQRLSVLNDAQRQPLRLWYEALLDIGATLYK